MSVSGAFTTAIDQALKAEATALQIFTKSQLRWQAPPIKPDEVKAFHQAYSASGLQFLCSHDSYLINLAASAEETWNKSVPALIQELERAELLGCFCVVLHPGSPKADSRETGISRIVKGLKEVLRATAGLKVRIALENTAGQGATLGNSFAELAAMIQGAGADPRLGICFDSCHGFAAGYELRTPQAVTAMVDELDREIGLNRLLMLHLNDSKKDCGSRIDRHEHIGKGCIGEAGFHCLLREPRLQGIPGIIETPKEDTVEMAEDRENLALLRRLEAG